MALRNAVIRLRDAIGVFFAQWLEYLDAQTPDPVEPVEPPETPIRPRCGLDEWNSGVWWPSDRGQYGDVVNLASVDVRTTWDQPRSVTRGNPSAYTKRVAAKLRDMGYCADWGAPPRGDGSRGSHDEVAVWRPGDRVREQWDCVLGNGMLVTPFLASKVLRRGVSTVDLTAEERA